MRYKIEVGQVWNYDNVNYKIIKIENNKAYAYDHCMWSIFNIDKEGYVNIVGSSWRLVNSNQCINDCCRDNI